MQNRFREVGSASRHDHETISGQRSGQRGGFKALVGIGLAAALLGPVPVAAQTPAEPDKSTNRGIEEIVVRAGESESTADFGVGDSVTGFGADDLEALGVQDIADLAAFTPNLEIVTQGATTPTFFIRGVGLNDFNSNSTGAVAIYMDEVARNAPAIQLSKLFDIEAVNVVKGPQGTGLFRNASAGAIKIYSKKPSGEFGGYLRSDIGNFNSRDFEGAVEAPIFKDILAGRVAFGFTQRDGTMKNRCGSAPAFADRITNPGPLALRTLGLKQTDPPFSICGEPVTAGRISPIPVGLEKRLNNRDDWAMRATLLFRPTLDMDWTLNFHGAKRDELSRVGQSLGTQGSTCRDGDISNCDLIGDRGDGSARIEGTLGGPQGIAFSGYRPPEVVRRLEELAPCNIGVPGRPQGTCLLSAANRASDNAGKIRLAKELSRDLDSKPQKGDFNRTGDTENNTWGGYLNGGIVLPFGIQLTTVTSADTYDREIDLDLDFSPETLFQIVTDDDGWQVAQDIRLEGQHGDEAQFRWDIGGYFLREQLDVEVTNDLGVLSTFGVGSREYTQDLWSGAGYISMAFDFWEDFTLDGGFRYNTEQKKLDFLLLQGSGTTKATKLDETWSAPTGTVRLTYRFREDTHVFWKYTRGWKPGSFNATSSLVTGVTTADPEKIDSFETGISGSWFDGRFGINSSFFFYRYQDYQLFTAQQFSGGQPEFVILNADEAEVFGAEIDAVLRPWTGGFAQVRASWLESQFLDFVQNQQAVIVVSGAQVTVDRELNNTGNPLLNSPRFKVSLTLEQSLPLGRWGTLTGRWDGVWTDTTYFDATKGRGIPNVDNIAFLPDDTIAQRPFWMHNLRLTYAPIGGQVQMSGWVRNVTNETFKTFAFDASTFSRTSIYFVGDPRTYGGSLTVTF
jgi:outer membrane receptor protein involved in Fe transport